MIESELRERSSGLLDPTTRHWGLFGDPFLALASVYVETPTHHQALARLSELIESGEPIGTLSGESGLGKTTILNQLTRKMRRPNRRSVQIPSPLDGNQLLSTVNTALAKPALQSVRETSGNETIALLMTLEKAFRVQAYQKTQVVLLIDDCRNLTTPSQAHHLKRLQELARTAKLPLTMILTTDDEAAVRVQDSLGDTLPTRLKRLMRSEANAYLVEKLRLAGRTGEVFTSKAMTSLHAQSLGIPRTLDRLASLCLRLGASHDLEMITPEVVDAATQDLLPTTIR